MTNRVVFAHIGIHKTATTWLQRDVFPQHPELWVATVGTRPARIPKLIKQLWMINELSFNPDEWHQEFTTLLNEHVPPERIVGLSAENLSGHGMTGARSAYLTQRLATLFPQLKIILVLRHPVQYVKSIYTQYVIEGGTKSLGVFLCDSTIPGRALVQRLDYQGLIRLYQQTFGKQNVLVLPYEWLRESPTDYLNAMWAFIGVSPFDDTAISQRKQNPSLSIPSLWLTRMATQLGFDSDKARRRIQRVERALARRNVKLPKLTVSYAYLASIEIGLTYPAFSDVLKPENYEIWQGELARFNYQFP